VYTPLGASIHVALGKISGATVKAWWYDTRTGTASAIGEFSNRGTRIFTPPETPARGNDWVLVLDDAARGFGAPGGVNAVQQEKGNEWTPIRGLRRGILGAVSTSGMAIRFGVEKSSLSDAAKLAIEWGLSEIIRPDWRRVFDRETLSSAIHEMLHTPVSPA
jgi:hypothetical protein